MVEANRYKIPEIGSGRWLRDLAIAIKPISETLNATFIKHSTNDAKNDSSLYLKAGVRIREFVGTNNNPSKGRVVRGAAFAAEFDEEQATDDDRKDDRKKCQCYYAFPELRPKHYRPSKKLAEKVAKALDDNEELAEEVDIIRKELEAKMDKMD